MDQIWQQQLTLVSYGNQFLQQDVAIDSWLQHAIFYGQQFQFRDLSSHAPLAPHFYIWLQELKKQGVQRLSLHSAQLLRKDKNPNPHVELLDAAPILVSHGKKSKTAWILGRELQQWDIDAQFKQPITQRHNIQIHQLWRYPLNAKHHKKLLADLGPLAWDTEHARLLQQFITLAEAQGFECTLALDNLFYGNTLIESHPDSSTMQEIKLLAIIPAAFPAPLAHAWLQRATALNDWLDEHPQHMNAQFRTTWAVAFSKLIIDIANHYPSAQLSPVVAEHVALHSTAQVHHVTVWRVLFVVILLCAAGYYFGL